MNKILTTILIYCLTITSVMAGLPPTTLGGRSQTAKTTFNFKVPNSQLTSLGGVTNLIETGNDNILVNPNFEDTTLTGWTCTTGTCTSTTTAGEFSEGSAGYKVALSAQAMNVSQSVSTISGSTTQYVVGTSYRVPSTMADFQICTLIAGAEKTCVPSANLILDDAYHTIEIPEVITPGSTVGIKFKTTSTYTANAFFDKAYIKQGIGTQNLALDNVYSAHGVTTSGTVTLENKDFVSSCSAANPTVCTFNTGFFTATPNCSVSAVNLGANSVHITALSSTGVSVESFNTTTGAAAASVEFTLTCQKSGNDYLASSAAVYSQNSANTNWVACTFSKLTDATDGFYGLGTVTNNSMQCRRNNGMLEMKGVLTTGTTSANEMRIPLPTNFGTITTATLSSNAESFGTILYSGASTSSLYNAIASSGNSYFNISAAMIAAANNPTSPGVGNAVFGTGVVLVLKDIKIPIASWSNSSTITGSFQNMVSTKGVDRPSLVSAVVSGTEVITEDDSVFLSSCTNAAPSVCTLTSGFFTATPKCWANPNATGTTALVSTRSTTSVTVERTDAATAFTLFCHGAR